MAEAAGGVRFARSAADVTEWLSAIGNPAFVAVDTETAGWDPQTDRLVLVQVHAGPAHSTLVVDPAAVSPAVLAPLFGDGRVAKVFHNGAFDVRFLSAAGV